MYRSKEILINRYIHLSWVAWLLLALPFSFLVSLPENFLLVPRTGIPLLQLLFSPLVHISLDHLLNNLEVLLPAAVIIYSIYKEDHNRILVINLVTSGFLLWVFGERAIHVGLSGFAISLCFFILFSAFLSGERKKLLIGILFGFIQLYLFMNFYEGKEGVSVDSHICGAVSGSVTAFFFENSAIKKIYT